MSDETPVEVAETELVTLDELPEELRCMPIFREFKPETLKALCEQTWLNFPDENRYSGPTQNPRCFVDVHSERYDLHATDVRCCPLAFCLLYEGRAWVTKPTLEPELDIAYIEVDGEWMEQDTTGNYGPLAKIEPSPSAVAIPAQLITIDFVGEPGSDTVARQILGVPSHLRSESTVYLDWDNDRREKYSELVDAAADFIVAWDYGRIGPQHLSLVACPAPAETDESSWRPT